MTLDHKIESVHCFVKVNVCAKFQKFPQGVHEIEWDRWTYGWTDGRSDSQPEIILALAIAIPGSVRTI